MYLTKYLEETTHSQTQNASILHISLIIWLKVMLDNILL